MIPPLIYVRVSHPVINQFNIYYYQIELETNIEHIDGRWIFKKRYSDFTAFFANLEKHVETMEGIPELPGKLWKRNPTEEDIKDRRLKLEKFLIGLIKSPFFRRDSTMKIIKEFIQ